ncbi:hypothetical protein [Modestobacter versicolor]|uniref:hypothetical protein n=1 Tax=Modestobacter versicolor TaxID=429133 RepID=UPI0034DF502B
MRTLSYRTLLLPLVVAPLLLTGCSSDDESGPATSDASSSSESAAEAAAEADAEKKDTFCTEVPDLLSDIAGDLEGFQADPQSAPALLDDAVERISAVEPPADVAPEWQRLVTAWTGMRDLIAQADLTDPSANTGLAPQLQTLQTELIDSGTAVDDYGKANC